MMKRLIATITLAALFVAAFGQSKLDNLTDNPTKQDGHFVGKIGKVVSSDPYMWTYSIAFDFWSSFDEPVYMFYFKWDMKLEAGSNTVKVNNVSKRYSGYPEIWTRMKKQLTPLTSMKDGELLTVPLYIQLRQGNKVLAHIQHNAKIDLPDPAGKWNVFALPSTNDWIEAFQPLTGVHAPFLGAGHKPYDYKLQDLQRSNNKEEYAKLMKTIWKEADNIKVVAGAIYNIRWNVTDYEYAVKEKAAAQKQATTATASKASEIDELMGSTGYSQKDKAAKNTTPTAAGIDRADAAYHKITDYKDKAALNEAKRLYQEAAANPETAAYAKNQIAMIDRVLNYKELDITPNLDGVWVIENGFKIEIQGDKAVILSIGASKFGAKAIEKKLVVLNSSLQLKDIIYSGNYTWSCLSAWVTEWSGGNLDVHYEKCSIKMNPDTNNITAIVSYEGKTSTAYYTREK